jgi:hypothetical protein
MCFYCVLCCNRLPLRIGALKFCLSFSLGDFVCNLFCCMLLILEDIILKQHVTIVRCFSPNLSLSLIWESVHQLLPLDFHSVVCQYRKKEVIYNTTVI